MQYVVVWGLVGMIIGSTKGGEAAHPLVTLGG